MKAWALLSKLDSRSWESNDGYPDEIGSTYVYDSGVANHLRVQVGDMILLRDSRSIHGVSRIDRIDTQPDVKIRYVCPRCERPGQIPRKNKAPKYLCRHEACRNEFDKPLPLEVPVTRYVASYGAQWQALDGALPFHAIEPLLDNAQQNAIRRCDRTAYARCSRNSRCRSHPPRRHGLVPQREDGGRHLYEYAMGRSSFVRVSWNGTGCDAQ